jgi:PAS domain S-box-containing protein
MTKRILAIRTVVALAGALALLFASAQHSAVIATAVLLALAALQGQLLVLNRRHARTRQVELAQSEQRFRDIAGSVTVPMLISRLPDGQIMFANRHVVEILGMDTSKVLAHGTPDFYADAADRTRLLAALMKTGSLENFEIGVRTRKGVRRAVVSARLIDFEGQRCVVCTFYDVTARGRERGTQRRYRGG